MKKKKAIKWTVLVLLSPVLLFIILTVLLYVPPIQNWVVQRVTAYASEETGMDISIGHVSIAFPLDLEVNDILVISPPPSTLHHSPSTLHPSPSTLHPSPSTQQDTIADIRRAVADVQLWPLLHGEVVLDELLLADARLNTLDFIGDLRLQGTIGELALTSPGIKLEPMEMMLRQPRLRHTDLNIFMSDTGAVDTSTVGWHICIDRFELEQTRLNIVIDSAALFAGYGNQPQPDSTAAAPTSISLFMGQAAINDADLHLGLGRFSFGNIDWQGGALAYDDELAINGLSLCLDSLYSHGDNLRLGIRSGSAGDIQTPITPQGGLSLTALQGRVNMDGERLQLGGFSVQTPHSYLEADADISLAAIAGNDSQGNCSFTAMASLGKADLLLTDPEMPASLLPDQPVTLHAAMNGTPVKIDIERFNIMLPTVFEAEASGWLGRRQLSSGSIANTLASRLLAQLDVSARAYALDPLLKHYGLPSNLRVPNGLNLSGKVGADGPAYTADLTMREGLGLAKLKGAFDTQSERFTAEASLNGIDMRHFMPGDSLGLVSADITLKGTGTDPFAPACSMEGDVQLHRLHYGSNLFDSLQATASINGGHAIVSARSNNASLKGTVDIDAYISKKKTHDPGDKPLKGTIEAEMSAIDLYALGAVNEPTVVGFSGSVELESDLELTHRLSAFVSNISLRDSVKTHHPENLGVLLKTRPDTTVVRVQSGDFIVKVDARGDYERLLAGLAAIGDSVSSQIKNRVIDQTLLKEMLPEAKLYITSQRGNPVADILKVATGIDFQDLNIDLTSSPSKGLNGTARLLRFSKGDFGIDTMRISLVDKGTRLSFNGQVTNGKKNKTGTFNILFDGQLRQHGAAIGIRYFDEAGRLNIRIGAQAEMVEQGLRFQLIPAQPILGYREFTLNDDNYLLLHENLRLEANVDLKAEDGTRILVYSGNSGDSGQSEDSGQSGNSGESEESLLQDFTISVHQMDLGPLTDDLAMLPDIDGVLNGDYHLMMDRHHSISVASDMHIDGMAYENCPIGNLGSEFVYLLREDGTHVIDATLTLDDQPIGTLQGSLSGNRLDGTLDLSSMPLNIIDGFMPDQLLGFEGTADGTLSVKGPTNKLNANGQLRFTNGYLVSTPYGMRMRFGDKPVQISNSRLIFDEFALYSYNDNPLNITGSVDFNGTGTDAVDLRLRARNFQLVNAKQQKESVAYGKMFVNFFSRLTGNLEQLKMRGRLDVLGTTDLNYILLDSPLSTDNRMEELVRFTDFSDTTQTVVQRPESDALDLDVQLSIDQGAHVRCALNTDQTNYVDLLGGGDLRMRMNADGMHLTGRYTISSGTMKYSLPIIPLKTFKLQEGSYVEFTGDPGNPTLNITATERTRAAVSTEDGQSRSVAFDCGVVITRTLSDMGLQFIISSPEDSQVQNDLSSMGTEQRGKIAVTMLTTGMYLTDGNTSGFSMNSALSSFLQSEINSITSEALKTLDVQMGVDNSTDASGNMHTDYSFRFAKRFWNNRLSVQIGGRVSTGAEVQGQQQSFFDNVTMEYRLSPTSNQYVKLFFRQNVYDWLEGYTGEYGGGYLWKRKLDKLTDLFRSTPEQNLRRLPTDSLRQRRSLNTDSLLQRRDTLISKSQEHE